MADEPQNMVLVMLRDIRAKQDEHSAHFEQIEARLDDVEKQLDDYKKIEIRRGTMQGARR
jgi:hypothetical protein